MQNPQLVLVHGSPRQGELVPMWFAALRAAVKLRISYLAFSYLLVSSLHIGQHTSGEGGQYHG